MFLMISPEPNDYIDCVKFLRDMHKVILHHCALLETLLNDAEKEGVFASFATKPEWNSIFVFFQNDAPRHERDEERFFFPALAMRVSRVGFQQPNAPIRFLIEGHNVMQREMEGLVRDWKSFREQKRDSEEIASSHERHLAEDAAFIALGRVLVRLYREHIAREEERVYSVADKVLSGQERLMVMEEIRAAYGEEAVTEIPQFGEPRFSNSDYNVVYAPTEVIGEETMRTDEEEDEDNEDDFGGSDTL
jgi:hemerythrin-like domain-containing protein